MDNYNALSKSAILTKLALDGYFIDLLTLNSFIKSWQIEAIYENEFGIEFFDNTSYLTILNNLKEKYQKTKGTVPESPAEENTPAAPPEVKEELREEVKKEEAKEEHIAPEYSAPVSLDTLVEEQSVETPVQKPVETIIENPIETPVKEVINKSVAVEENNIADNFKEPEVEDDFECEEAIMPAAMKNLTPGPVSPNSHICVDHSYTPAPAPKISAPEDSVKIDNNSYTTNEDLMEIFEDESFSKEEIEKANNLINNASVKEDKSKNEQKNDELDLMQLAQSFAQNLTGAKDENVSPAELEDIFDGSYTKPFEELQDYVKEEEFILEEYKSLQEDLPSDVSNINTNPASVSGISSSNLTAQDVRDIIREEISRQNTNIVPASRGENIKDIVREIVQQTADVAPQNAFKLDISHRTLDLIAKSIAKKIAVKLNDYYKLNSSKHDAKLQLYRDRTLDLKEKNQRLAEENKKLKALLHESNKNLNSYKPTVFGLFKYTGKKRRR